MNELVDFEKWKIPLKIEYAENKGRYVVATQDFSKDSRIVAIKGYSTGIIDSYKKKICSVCFSVNNDGFYDISCKSCNVVYYCSEVCHMYAQRKLNHDMICPLLRRLSTFKSDIHSKSIMKLLLNSLALRKSEEEFLKYKKENMDKAAMSIPEGNINNNEINNNNSNNDNWLSLVPLPTDIEEYEKEIEEMNKKNEEMNKLNNENNEDNEMDNKEKPEDTLDSDTIEEEGKEENEEEEEEEGKKSEKDKSKKKHKKKSKKDKMKNEDEKEKDDKKKHKHKKDKKEKKEENGNENEKEEKEEKKKHKHKKSKKDKKNEEKDETDETKDENIEDKETNSEKYDVITNTIPYSGTFKDMMNLQSHYEEWTDDMKKEWQKNINFFKKLLQESKEINEYMTNAVKEYVYKKRKENQTQTEDIDMDKEIENFIMSFASLVESNSFGIWNNRDKCIGRIIYPFASYFNHSCRNNCYPIQFKNHIYFYALKDIKKGEEINFSYIDTKDVSLKDRRTHLMNDYYFKCQCELCCEEEKQASLSSVSKKKSKKKK